MVGFKLVALQYMKNSKPAIPPIMLVLGIITSNLAVAPNFCKLEKHPPATTDGD